MVNGTLLDRAIGYFSPTWQMKRLRARLAADLAKRHYEAAAYSRRTAGWNRSRGDANAVIGPALATLRATAHDLVRNNPYAESAVSTIVDHTVGWGILAKSQPASPAWMDRWNAWADSTMCDADGRHNFAGLQKLVMRSVVVSGEVLVRRRLRWADDGLAIPMQLQVLEPDFLDTSRDVAPLTGNRIIQGVEFDVLGRAVAYWLFREHPGSSLAGAGESVRVPAESVLHIFKSSRPGQVRGPSWFAPVLLRFKDYEEYEDATLMKQKIAACLSVLTTDPAGTSPSLGDVVTGGDSGSGSRQIDMLEPGMVLNVPPGRSIEVVQPPKVDEYDSYSRTNLRAIATGLGVTYEDLTGDYSDMPFSAARMSRLRHWARVEDWRWHLMIPQFCDPVWAWALQAAGVTGLRLSEPPKARWSAPPAPMVDPVNEGKAYQQLLRAGLETLGNVLRERGYDPDEHLAEIAEFNKKLDELGLVLDSDPRRLSGQGQAHGSSATGDDSKLDTKGPEVASKDAERIARWRRLRRSA